MYPSPRLKIPDPTAMPSLKKKPRPNVTRQLFALPAIKQFDPVRATTHSTSPLSSTGNADERVQESALHVDGGMQHPAWAVPMVPLSHSPLQPHRPKNDDTTSPRLRPQPPQHAAAVASRTDQELFRYNQGVRQRMSIRPLFEQRREEEAEVARLILTSRGSDSPQRRQDHVRDGNRTASDDQQEAASSTPRRSAKTSSRRATTPTTVSEMAAMDSTPPRQSSPQVDHVERAYGSRPSTHTKSRSGGVLNGGDSTGQGHRDEEDDEGTQIVHIRFRTPTPPSSAGPSRSHIAAHDQVQPQPVQHNPTESLPTQPMASEADPAVDSVAEETPFSVSALVEPLQPSLLHEPFLNKESTKLSWLRREKLTMESSSPRAPSGTNKHEVVNQPTRVCFKVLWKDMRRFVDETGSSDEYVLRVLLGTNGKAVIDIRHARDDNEEEGVKLAISDADLVVSTRTRPDIPVMTPKWAQYVISRVERDARGAWFMRVQNIGEMGDLCVFEDEVSITQRGGGETRETQIVSVTMYLLGGDGANAAATALLVHARDRSATSPSLTEVIFHHEELVALATPVPVSEEEDITEDRVLVSDEQLREKLRDKEFLRSAVAEGKALRLALMSGLHVTEETQSFADLSFRSGSCAATASARTSSREVASSETNSASAKGQAANHSGVQYEALGLVYASDDVRAILMENPDLAELAFVAQAYCDEGARAALRWFRQQEAVEAHVANYIRPSPEDDAALVDAVRSRIEAATRAKLEEIAVFSIVEDMISDFIAVECRLELHHVKYSGGFDDYYASKVQATYRMSYHRRGYENRRNVRLRAARLLQALQRGITARKRYAEMRVEREKYLFFGIRSSLHQSTSRVEDPRQRTADHARETERRRQTFLMHVLHGYVAKHGIPVPFRISADVVQHVISQYSVVVGCPVTLGDSVAAILRSSRQPQEPVIKGERRTTCNARLYGSSEIHAALVTALRMQYDDTYGLSSGVRQLAATTQSPSKRTQLVVSAATRDIVSSDNTPPRWLLKVNVPFQRANRNRVAALRLTRKAAGQQAAHLVAFDYRSLLLEAFHDFDKCRSIWSACIATRQARMHQFDAFTQEELVQYVLDRLILSVKDWGLDTDPLFEALNVCLLHRLGKEAVASAEQAFNKYAEGVNESHGRRGVFPLRDEISQELEEFEALVAIRCLNIANEKVAAVPPSEILHVLLFGQVNEEYLRHALPSVLPIATVNEKVQLANKVIQAYADSSHGEAFNAICWSCLDTAENVTVEAAKFLDRISQDEASDTDGDSGKEQGMDMDPRHLSIVTRALYILTGSNALRFLQFLSKVAHFNKATQHRVLTCLAPYAAQLELYRLASVLCSLESFEVVSRLFDATFAAENVHRSTRFWVQYGALFGEADAEAARASCGATIFPQTTGMELPESSVPDTNTTSEGEGMGEVP